jgi:uncharacterized protein (DUF4213/DUF364 family)
LSRILNALLNTPLNGNVREVLIGLHWTAVVVEANGERRCGLASTLSPPHHIHGVVDVPEAGRLVDMDGPALLELAKSERPLLAGVGVATINALLRPDPEQLLDRNAEAVIAAQGAGKKVALIGHFPFVERLRTRVGELWVLEQNPQPGDLPAASASELLPQADIVAITGTTLVNHTLDKLLAYCAPQAAVILLGPSTPLSPLLFDRKQGGGIDILCGSVVFDIDPVLQVIGQGGNFRQVRRAGVRTVTMARPGLQLAGSG